MSTERHDGAPGAQGAQGAGGQQGLSGGHHDDAVAFRPVTVEEFREQLTKPALLSASPTSAVAGASVTLNTLRLQTTDSLLIDDVVVPMAVVADTMATFTVPPAAFGGFRTLQVRQADGTLSNRMTFYVQPHLDVVGDGTRATPAATVTVKGSGFAPDARIRVNGEDMANSTFIDGTTMTFTLHRPSATEENPDGETGHCTVILADGTSSNNVDFTIDTLRIVVIGDSVAAGQGLRPHEKPLALVERALSATRGGIKSYTANFAHSGAIIGVGDNTVMDAIDPEVPTSYPTVMQQLDIFTGNGDSVDYVIVTAGLNDVNFRTVLDPLTIPKKFAPSVYQHCHRDLRTLLNAATERFPRATIVATNYYPMVSDDSDLGRLGALLIAVGLPAVIASPQVITNCRVFHDLSTMAIRSAVNDVNDRLPEPRAIFVDAGFGARNAALASEPWLYGINPDLTAQDPFTAGDRAVACRINPTRTDIAQCERASIGHPNAAGAEAYGRAIAAALQAGPTESDDRLPDFPAGFLFGVATASMQNEGGIENNDWAAFTTSPAIKNRVAVITEKGGGPAAQLEPPGLALNHADLTVLAADLDAAVALGVNTYRFSVEWARLQPTKPGHGGPLTDADFDMAAVAYYDSVLDELAARAITPVLSVNHLTLPLWVLDPPRNGAFSAASFGGVEVASANDPNYEGSLRGWETSETVDEYLRLTAYLAARWASRVTWWVTLNEPVGSMVGAGYFAGIWPPGFTGDAARGKTAYFNLIRAHLRAYEIIKAAIPTAMVGLAHAMLDAKITSALSDTILGDQDAARNQFDYFYNWHILDAIIDGRLDTAINRRSNERTYREGVEFAKFMGLDPTQPWHAHCDYVGVNYYRSVYVFNDHGVSIAIGFSGGRFVNDLNSAAARDEVPQLLNSLGWEISPAGFGSILRGVHDRYNLPVLVTENGIPQEVDRMRGAYLTAHLGELLSAQAAGVDIRGYLYWTLVDNWEWHEGYRPQARFGLYTVDRADPTMQRRLTDGANAFAYAIANNSVRGARERFGTLAEAGNQVRPPRSSSAFFTGSLDGHPIEMVLHPSRHDGSLNGLLWQADSRLLLRLKGSVNAQTSQLELEHPASGGLPAGVMSATLTDGATWTGTLTYAGLVDQAWSVTKDALVGQWAGTGSVPRVQILRTPGGLAAYSGSWLSDDLPRAWRPMNVTVTGGKVRLEAADIRGNVTLAGNALSGTFEVAGSSETWTAARLADVRI